MTRETDETRTNAGTTDNRSSAANDSAGDGKAGDSPADRDPPKSGQAIAAYLQRTAHWNHDRFIMVAQSDPDAVLAAVRVGPLYIASRDGTALVGLDGHVYEELERSSKTPPVAETIRTSEGETQAKPDIAKDQANATEATAAAQSTARLNQKRPLRAEFRMRRWPGHGIYREHRRLLDRAWRFHEQGIIGADQYEVLRRGLDTLAPEIKDWHAATHWTTPGISFSDKNKAELAAQHTALDASLRRIAAELNAAAGIETEDPELMPIALSEITALLKDMAAGRGQIRLNAFDTMPDKQPWRSRYNTNIAIRCDGWRLSLRRRSYGFDHIARIESPDGRSARFKQISEQGDPAAGLTVLERDALERRLERLGLDGAW